VGTGNRTPENESGPAFRLTADMATNSLCTSGGQLALHILSSPTKQFPVVRLAQIGSMCHSLNSPKAICDKVRSLR